MIKKIFCCVSAAVIFLMVASGVVSAGNDVKRSADHPSFVFQVPRIVYCVLYVKGI